MRNTTRNETSRKDQEHLEMVTWGLTTIFQEAQRVDYILTMKKKNKEDKEDDDENCGGNTKPWKHRSQVSWDEY